MAKIITSQDTKRRTIRLTSADIISIVREYQQVMKGAYSENARDILANTVFYLPEDI